MGRITNNLAEQKQRPAQIKPGARMNRVLQGAMKEQFDQVLRDKSNGFIASLLDLYSSDSYLAKCDPTEVAKEALKAATLDLPINKQLGFAYIVPYKNVPTFMVGYKGYIQLAMRSGVYKYINSGPVYEGELAAIDKLTGEIDLSGEKLSEDVTGYFAFIETINGFRKTVYWTRDEVLAHARKFSPSFSSSKSVWKSDFDAMATKTVMRHLLSKYGLLSVEMQKALEYDEQPSYDYENEPDTIDETPTGEAIEAEYEVSEEPAEVEPEQTKIDNNVQ